MRLLASPSKLALSTLAGAIGSLWIAVAPAQALATFSACGAEVASKASPTVACQTINGATNDDSALVNTAPGMFELTSWEFLARDNVAPEVGDVETLLTGDPNEALSGTFDVSGVSVGFESLALVFKSDGSSSPSCLVGYLLEKGALSGIYNSPFVNCQGEFKEISHATLYGSLESSSAFQAAVPLPASAALLIAAAGGLAAMRRSRCGPRP